MADDSSRSHEKLFLLSLLIAVVVVYFPIVGLPGYFSNDELQWGAFSDREWSALPWVSWHDWQAFQYRPLTFNLWLIISWALFDRPELFHGLWLALAVVNAYLIFSTVNAVARDARVGLFAALVFMLVPYAVYVHSWVATLADILVLFFSLLIVKLVVSDSSRVSLVGGTLVLTAAALLAKESAISIPGFLLLGALVSADGQRRRCLVAGAVSGTIALAYLLMRMETLTATTVSSTGYGLDPASGFLRLIRYLVYPFITRAFEITGSFGGWSPWKHGGVIMVLLALFWISLGARRALLMIVALAIALGPVLVLGREANQYGYLFAAVLAAGLAFGWARRRSVISRTVTAFLIMLLAVHGFRVAGNFEWAGNAQARFYDGVSSRLADPSAEPLRVWVDCPKRDWLFKRITHEIPAFRGVELGERLMLAQTLEDSTDYVTCDGVLQPTVPDVGAPVPQHPF